MGSVNNFKSLLKFEDAAIRLMYFFNTMDTFLVFSSGLFVLLAYFFKIGIPLQGSFFSLALIYIILYLILRLADFHPLFLLFTPFYLYFLARLNPELALDLKSVFIPMFIFTSLIQILIMGIPMSLAARRADIPLRIYLHSFFIFAPTTISMPLTIYYQLLLILSTKSILVNFYRAESIALVVSFLAIAILVRAFKKKQFVPGVFHPAAKEQYFKRVILLNIDGLSYHAFNLADAPFLKRIAGDHAYVEGGAYTVYRALTNSAFASILSGVVPQKHRVLNNNLGQSIKAEALPDYINTRLYGSMHIKHFSRSQWQVETVSLVKSGYDQADRLLLEQVREEMKKFDQVQLWVIDLSEVDYTGHCWGTYSKEYLQAIQKTDSLIEEFFRWLDQEKLSEDSLVIISSDHGMFIIEHSFILSSQEERVPLIFAGKRIAKNKISKKVSILDIAANISYALNKRYCQNSGGRVFEDIFKRG